MSTNGTLWEVVVDGSAKTFRLMKQSAVDAARNWKAKSPHAEVRIRKHGSEGCPFILWVSGVVRRDQHWARGAVPLRVDRRTYCFSAGGILSPVVVSRFGTTPLAGADVAITAGSLAVRLLMLARTTMAPVKTKATTITRLQVLLVWGSVVALLTGALRFRLRSSKIALLLFRTKSIAS